MSMQFLAELRSLGMCDDLGAGDLPSIDEVLADPAASTWLKRRFVPLCVATR
jgi:hypothetical protein